MQNERWKKERVLTSKETKIFRIPVREFSESKIAFESSQPNHGAASKQPELLESRVNLVAIVCKSNYFVRISIECIFDTSTI